MNPVLLRWLFLGAYLLVWRFNRRILATGAKPRLRHEALWILGALGIPTAAWLIWPHPWLANLSWGLTFLVLIHLGWRLIMRLVNLAAVRSRPADIPAAKGRILTTRAMQLRSYCFEDAPAHFQGLSVALVSDFHCDGWPEPRWYDRYWQVVKSIQPDLLLLAGDYISRPESLPILRRCLRDLSHQHPVMGIHAILGNHDEVDADGVRAVLQEFGIHVLEDEACTLVHPNGRSIRLAGTSWPWCGSESLRKCMSEGAVDIVLTHTPDNAAELANAGASWILAGHTHGGQVALPLLGGVFSPSRFGGRWIYGHHVIGHSHLVVTSGVGCTFMPLRMLVHPEIVLLRF